MKKRLVSMVLAAVFLLGIGGGASAAPYVCFTVINDSISALSDGTMPVFYNSSVYVPYTVFTSMGFYASTDSSGNSMILYSSDQKAIVFESDTGRCYDLDGNEYYGPVVRQNGVMYLPAVIVCHVFNMSLSYISGDDYDVLRINSVSSPLTDTQFMNAAANTLRSRYNNYVGISQPAEDPEEEQTSPGEGTQEPESEEEEPEDEEEGSGTVFLSFIGMPPEEETELLDALDAAGVKACFFVDREDLLSSGGAVRRAAASGHSIGVYLSDGEGDYSQISRGIFEACGVNTALVWDSSETVQSESLIALSGSVVSDGTGLYSAFGTGGFQELAVTVDLSGGIPYDLFQFINTLKSEGYNILAPNEVVYPG